MLTVFVEMEEAPANPEICIPVKPTPPTQLENELPVTVCIGLPVQRFAHPVIDVVPPVIVIFEKLLLV